MRTKQLKYWACQIAGWGAYSMVGLSVAVLETGWRPSIVFGYLFFFGYSIGLSHLLRRAIRSRQWTSPSSPFGADLTDNGQHLDRRGRERSGGGCLYRD